MMWGFENMHHAISLVNLKKILNRLGGKFRMTEWKLLGSNYPIFFSGLFTRVQ